MSDVIVSYKGSPIIDLSASGSKTIKTAGKYCEADLSLQYTKPSGGGAFILITSSKGATLTCGEQTYTLTGDETEHAFAVSLGTYVCTASKTGFASKSKTVVVSTETVYKVEVNPSRLPSGYREVEYLQTGNGACVLDINIPTDYYTIITKVRFDETLVPVDWAGDTIYTSKRESTAQFRYYAGVGRSIGTQEGFYAGWGGGVASGNGYVNNLFDVGDNEWRDYKFIISSDLYEIYVNDFLTFSSSNPVPVIDTNYMMSVMSSLKAQSRASYGQYEIKSVTGLSVRHLVPCYRLSDNKPGMYDLAGSICPLTNSPFYINSGSGEFVVGPDV